MINKPFPDLNAQFNLDPSDFYTYIRLHYLLACHKPPQTLSYLDLHTYLSDTSTTVQGISFFYTYTQHLNYLDPVVVLWNGNENWETYLALTPRGCSVHKKSHEMCFSLGPLYQNPV